MEHLYKKTKSINEVNKIIIGNWVDVKDRLPEKGLNVLVNVLDFEDDENFMFVAKFYNDSFSIPYDPAQTTKVTHWMPLPKPPKL